MTVSGRIEFGTEAPSLREATLHVWIEDTTYADAPAVRVAGRHLPAIADERIPRGIPFTIEWDDASARLPGRTYTIAAFIDLDGDGRPGPGDYLCPEAVAVPRPGTAARLPVRRIG